MGRLTRLLLIRHGAPNEEARGRCYGSLDFGLSEAGRELALSTARELGDIELDAVYSSPRLRAVETARPLAELHHLEVRIDPRLREIDFGELEGRTYEEIEREEPALFARWMEEPTNVEFPGGESYGNLRARVVPAMDEVVRTHAAGTTAIVTHGGVIRALLAHCLLMPDAAVFRLEQSYCGVSVVDWFDGVPLVRGMNSVLYSTRRPIGT